MGNVLSGAVLQSNEGRVSSHQTYTKVPLCQICCLLFILVSAFVYIQTESIRTIFEIYESRKKGGDKIFFDHSHL